MSKRILIVDDSEYVAESFARLIALCGYETRTAYSGRDALDQTADFRPDMVLMDLCMPGLDGYETARTIRLDQGNAKVVIVAVSCLAEANERQRALESGFNRHVPKPVSLSTLYGLLTLLYPDQPCRRDLQFLGG